MVVMVARALAVVVANGCAVAIGAAQEDLNLLCLSEPSRANKSLPIKIMSTPNDNKRSKAICVTPNVCREQNAL